MIKKLLNLFIFIIFFSALPEKVYSQSDEFPIGAYLVGRPDKPATPPLYNNYYSIKEAGLNTVFQYCIPVNDPLYNSNKDSLMQFESVITFNGFKQNDYVHHYSAGMYSKWEAENNQTDESKIGIKHEFGSQTNHLGVQCWYSGNDPAKINQELVYGPHYFQYKKYPLYYNGNTINYILKVRIIKGTPSLGKQDVCKISVIDEDGVPLRVRYINESALQTEWNSQSIFELAPYWHNTSTEEYSPTDPYYKLMDLDDSKSDKIGTVQYKIEWLANIPIYVDYIEVYDQNIWKEFLEDSSIEDSIINYAGYFSDWNNIKYWNSLDEPHSVDSHIPYKTIDDILTANNKPNLITAFYPEWNGQRDGVNSIKLFANGIANTAAGADPGKLMIYYYPYWPDTENFDDVIGDVSTVLQNAWEEDENYWFLSQAMESRTASHDSTMLRRRPTRTEFRAPVMMALQYGAKGIMFWPYYTYWENDIIGNDTIRYKRAWAIEDNPNDDSNFERTDLWYELKEIATRLNGKLGQTLLNAEYINAGMKTNSARTDVGSYLEFDPVNTNWFSTNLLENKNDPYLKYFMVVNCNSDSATGANQPYNFKIKDLTNFNNWYWKNVEDTTDTRNVFNQTMPGDSTHALHAGDGRLYEVAPVIKYGGNLKFNETISQSITIHNDVTVDAGVTLTVASGVTLTFENGASLIVNGTLNVNGTAGRKVTFNFMEIEYPNGIVFKSGSTGSIEYAIIKNGWYGVRADYSNPDIENCEIKDCRFGIVYYNNNNTSGDAEVLNNHIHNNTLYGISFSSSTGRVRANEINDNYRGVYCTTNSSPYLGESETYGNNNIYDNYSGVYSYSNSNPFLGRQACVDHGTRNILDNTNYNIYANDTCLIMAELNWWGQNPPDTSKIYAGTGSTIDYTPYLTSAPSLKTSNGKSSPEELVFDAKFPSNSLESGNTQSSNAASKLNPEWPLFWKLLYARNLIQIREYKSAQDICMDLISENPDSSLSYYALDLLWQASRKYDTERFNMTLKDL